MHAVLCSFMVMSVGYGEQSVLPINAELPPPEEMLVQSYHQGEEELMLESLIKLTEASLQSQKELLTAVQNYHRLQTSFISNQKDRRLAYQFLESSKNVLQIIQSSKMDHLFRKEFLEELAGLAGITASEEVMQ
jgi:hypothetical protein